eukprot:9474932-Pyramimonas_sp.AAC.1
MGSPVICEHFFVCPSAPSCTSGLSSPWRGWPYHGPATAWDLLGQPTKRKGSAQRSHEHPYTPVADCRYFWIPKSQSISSAFLLQESARFCCVCNSLGGPGPNPLNPPSYFMFLPTSSDRRVFLASSWREGSHSHFDPATPSH